MNRRKRRGIVLVLVAIVMGALFLLALYALDMGLVVMAEDQLQVAADAAALAGAAYVRTDVTMIEPAAMAAAKANTILDVRAAAQNYRVPVLLTPNPGNLAAGDVYYDHFNRLTGKFDGEGAPNAVRVVARRTSASLNKQLGLLFPNGPWTSSLDVERSAIAMVGGGSGAGLLVLDDDNPDAFKVGGSAILDVNNGDIQINSSNVEGGIAWGNSTVDAPNVNIVGGFTGESHVTGAVNEGSSALKDPLAYLPAPPITADLGKIDAKTTVTYGPGYYSGGIQIEGGADVTLLPGIYVLDGEGLTMKGNSILTANEVMFYITGTGVVDLGGTGAVTITPPTDGTYEHISFFQARTDTNECKIIGTADMNIQGTLYFPTSKINLGGTGIALGNQVICNEIEVFGSGTYTIVYDGAFPSAGNKIFLVK